MKNIMKRKNKGNICWHSIKSSHVKSWKKAEWLQVITIEIYIVMSSYLMHFFVVFFPCLPLIHFSQNNVHNSPIFCCLFQERKSRDHTNNFSLLPNKNFSKVCDKTKHSLGYTKYTNIKGCVISWLNSSE